MNWARDLLSRRPCSSPGDCYAEDRGQSYPVHIRDAAEAVLRLVEGQRAAACRAAMLARPVGGVGDDQTTRQPRQAPTRRVVRAVIVALLEAWRANAVGCGNGHAIYRVWYCCSTWPRCRRAARSRATTASMMVRVW